MPRAFITGITGQDGQHLAEFLHGKGYDVFGMVKGQNNPRIDADARGDAVHRAGARRPRRPAVAGRRRSSMAQPDEVYNLGAI